MIVIVVFDVFAENAELVQCEYLFGFFFFGGGGVSSFRHEVIGTNHSSGVPLPQVLSPTYKQRNEDFRKIFKKLPDTERLIVGEYKGMKRP